MPFQGYLSSGVTYAVHVSISGPASLPQPPSGCPLRSPLSSAERPQPVSPFSSGARTPPSTHVPPSQATFTVPSCPLSLPLSSTHMSLGNSPFSSFWEHSWCNRGKPSLSLPSIPQRRANILNILIPLLPFCLLPRLQSSPSWTAPNPNASFWSSRPFSIWLQHLGPPSPSPGPALWGSLSALGRIAPLLVSTPVKFHSSFLQGPLSSISFSSTGE